MRWSTITFLLLPLILASATAEWSWGGDAKPAEKPEEKSASLLQGEQLPEAQDKNFESNSTVLDDIVDELVSSKQGRSLGGFDDVYSDPTIKDALDAGDDAEARNLIKGRLCTLGLIQCEEEETQEKRYLSPDEVIYAQPVDIKPIGKPIASIPVRGPPRAYGPPQPMPYPSRPHKYPPKRIGYGGNPRPGFSEKYGVAGGNFQFSQSSAQYNAHESNFVTKSPIYATPGPYAYENTKPSYTKGSSNSGSKTDSVVQQHIHHHYVHDADKDPKVIIKPVAIPVGSIGQLNSQSIGSHSQSTDILTAGGGDYSSITSGGFKPMSGVFGLDNNKPIYESDTVYGSQYGHNSNKVGHNSHILSQGLPNQFANNAFEDQKYGNSLSSYATQNNEFYKKELHVGGSQNNLYNQGPATFGQNNAYSENYHEAKAQGFDCVCVNYDQCPSQEIIGRRDDLYLPIDPRNKGSEIVALTEEQLDNLNKTEATATNTETSSNATETKKISKRDTQEESTSETEKEAEPRQGYFGRPPVQQCRPNQVCCRRPLQPQAANKGQCGIRHSQGINGRIKTPSYVDGESEFGEYPWQTAILKKDPKESVYVCGGTLIDGLHIMTAAHCVKSYKGFELRVRLGEWDVNRDVEFYPYIERDIVSVHVHPLYYAGTLDNDLAILKMDHPVEWTKYPHISPACLPDKYTDYAGQRCWTTGWGKDAFGDYGKYQNILKEVDVPILSHGQCQQQLRQTRLGYNYELNPGFLCAGGEEGKDACKGDGGGPLVCERSGTWQIVGVVSWGIGCGQPGVPGVYVKVAQYLDWISQITGKYSNYN
uniref:Phenoloxidase-activating factor 2 n=1 Tax=Heliothis virescens TaxID=7102 RepID=A0A2A4JWX3_HELVI